MAALDTNVLVRYLVEDDAAQLALAKRLIERCVSVGDALFIPISVSLELEWVLRSNFGFRKDDVVQTLSQLLEAAELSFESEGALELALLLYQKDSAEYSDCMHVALAVASGEQPLWTFDKQHRRWRGHGCWLDSALGRPRCKTRAAAGDYATRACKRKKGSR